MKRGRQIFLLIIILSIVTSCDFIRNSFTYKDKTCELVETMIKEDYTKSVNCFALKHTLFKNTNIEILKKRLTGLRGVIVQNFGTELTFILMKSEKRISTVKILDIPPNTTEAYIQFTNGKEFGVFKVLFDDVSQKILNIEILDVKDPIPNMVTFWIIGFLMLLIPTFNIYIIILIRNSDFKKKWLKYLAILSLNAPAILYNAIGGFSISLLKIQLLLGISFSYMGYAHSYWAIGIPLGGIYWFWKLQLKDKMKGKAIIDDQIVPVN